MLSVEATIRSDDHIPFSITATGNERVSPKVVSTHVGSGRDVATCELNLSGSQLAVRCVFFLGSAKLLVWALLKLWLFEA